MTASSGRYFCPNCGRRRSPRAAFCSHCGMDFEADEPVEYINPQPAVSSVRSGNGGCLNSLGVAFVVLLAIVAALVLLQMLAQVGSAVRTAAGPPPYRYTTLAVPPPPPDFRDYHHTNKYGQCGFGRIFRHQRRE